MFTGLEVCNIAEERRWHQRRSSAILWGIGGLSLKKDRRPKRPRKVTISVMSFSGKSLLQTPRPVNKTRLEGAGRKKLPAISSANTDFERAFRVEIALGAV